MVLSLWGLYHSFHFFGILDKGFGEEYNAHMEKIKSLFIKYKEPILYLFFGGCTTLVSWVTYALFAGALGLGVNVSNGLSWVISVLFAFVTNKLFVFESKAHDLKTLLREGGEFVLARVLTGLLTLLGVPLLIRIGLDQSILGVEGMLAKISMSVIEVLLNYIFSKLFIFKKKG